MSHDHFISCANFARRSRKQAAIFVLASMMLLKLLTKSSRRCLIRMRNVICTIFIRRVSILFSNSFPLKTSFGDVGSNTKTLIYRQCHGRTTSFAKRLTNSAGTRTSRQPYGKDDRHGWQWVGFHMAQTF